MDRGLRAFVLALGCSLPAAPAAAQQGAAPAPAKAEPKKPSPSAQGSLFAVRGTETRRLLGTDRSWDASVLAATQFFSYDGAGLFSGRSLGFASLGGGSAGLEGGLGGAFGSGLRVPFGAEHGLLARLAFDGSIVGNEVFYASLLELPQGQVGYQILNHEFLLELAGTAGSVLAGRYNVDGAEKRRLGGYFQWGGHAAFGVGIVHLELAIDRLAPDESSLGSITRAVASLCGLPSVVAVCADLRYFTGDVRLASDGSMREASIGQVGVQLGLVTTRTSR